MKAILTHMNGFMCLIKIRVIARLKAIVFVLLIQSKSNVVGSVRIKHSRKKKNNMKYIIK